MVGERIKQLRIKKGYSISELARRAGVSKSYLSLIEKDVQMNPSLQFLSKIANSLDTTMDYFLDQNSVTNGTEQWDSEWLTLIQEAIKNGIKKDDFQTYLEFVRFQKLKKKPNNNS